MQYKMNSALPASKPVNMKFSNSSVEKQKQLCTLSYFKLPGDPLIRENKEEELEKSNISPASASMIMEASFESTATTTARNPMIKAHNIYMATMMASDTTTYILQSIQSVPRKDSWYEFEFSHCYSMMPR